MVFIYVKSSTLFCIQNFLSLDLIRAIIFSAALSCGEYGGIFINFARFFSRNLIVSCHLCRLALSIIIHDLFSFNPSFSSRSHRSFKKNIKIFVLMEKLDARIPSILLFENATTKLKFQGSASTATTEGVPLQLQLYILSDLMLIWNSSRKIMVYPLASKKYWIYAASQKTRFVSTSTIFFGILWALLKENFRISFRRNRHPEVDSLNEIMLATQMTIQSIYCDFSGCIFL